MNEQELAKWLRERQLSKFSELKNQLPEEHRELFTKELISSLPDKDTITTYLVCSHCGEWLVSYDEAMDLAERCKNIEEWLDKTEEIGRGH